MNVTYWTGFSKRKNSTKRPPSGTTVQDVHLKDDTSVLNPSIDSATIPANANYMYLADFGRYYYVRNVTKVGNSRNVFDLEVDVMATYKSNIGSTSALIEFCADSNRVTVTDPRNKPTERLWYKQSALLDLTASNPAFSTGGKYIIAVAGGAGGVTHYIMDTTNLKNFFAEVYSTDFFTQLNNQIYQLSDCIVSCKWVPYTPPQSGTIAAIPVGDQMISWSGMSVTEVATRYTDFADASYNIAFPSDDLGLGTNYLDMAPYTTGTLYLPFVGVVPLDLGVVANSKQIRIQMSIDNYTQDVVYKLSIDTGTDYISTYQGNCGTDIPIVARTIDSVGAVSAGLNVIGGAIAMGGGSATGALSVAGGIVQLAEALAVHTEVGGKIGTAISSHIGLKCIASIFTRIPTEQNLTAFAASSGMPLYEVDTISNHSGYVQCYNASVAMGGFPMEKDTVNDYVNSGFYYE